MVKRKKGGKKKRMLMKYRRQPTPRTGYLKTVQKTFDDVIVPIVPEASLQTRAWNISNLPNIAELSRLFDQYRITGIKLQFSQTTNTSDTVNPGMVFGTSINLDGGATPATWDTLLQRSNTRVTPWSSAGGSLPRRSLFLRPRFPNIIQAVAGGGANATALGNPKQWIDMAFLQVPHYGLDFGWYNPGNNINQPITVAITATYYLEFRKVK